MREYRGILIGGCEFVYGLYTEDYKGRSGITESESEMFPWYVQKESVGQFTGKKDKKGTKIYDGDILSEPVDSGEGIIDSIEPVFYREESAAFCVDQSSKKDQSVYQLLAECDTSRMKVIGNIHQNKDLL